MQTSVTNSMIKNSIKAVKASSKISFTRCLSTTIPAPAATEEKPVTNNNNNSSVQQGIWSDLNGRSQDLQIKNTALRNEILNGVDPKKGPLTLKRKINKIGYSTPTGLNEVFPLAYNILQQDAAAKYQQVAKIDEVISKTQDSVELSSLKKQKNKLLIDAEKFNPEVLYKVQFGNPENLNLGQPVFQHFYKTQKFEGYNKMLLMQRVEQLHVLPDAIPTIDPQVELNVKFVNESGINKYITPGETLSSKTTAKPPIFQVKSFEELNPEDRYTLLIVNLDVPDLKANSYQTSLNYGLKNLQLNSNNQIIGFDEKLNNEFVDYLPPTPEKNAPVNRFTVLLCKQSSEIGDIKGNFNREDFDLREFISEHGLSPVGINVWRSGWDSNVMQVRELYGLPKGRVFHRVRR